MFVRGNCVARNLLRGAIRLAGPSSSASAHRRLFSSIPAAVSAQPQQWTRTATDTLVTSARPLTPSDASYDGIAKVCVSVCDGSVSRVTPPSGRNHPLVDRHHRLPSRNAFTLHHHIVTPALYCPVLHAHVRPRGSHSIHRPNAGSGLAF